jgi:putative transposase
MAIGRPKPPLELSEEVKAQLEVMANSRSLPYAQVRRAQIILLSVQGLTNTAIAKRVGLSIKMVGTWRQRFIDQGLMGLYDQPKPGAPRTISDEQVAELIQKTLKSTPKGATHWTCRRIAKETNLSKSTVQRIWSAFNLQPHRQKHFTLSTDPYFVEKVHDVRTRPWCCVLMRKARFKRWTALRRYCRWAWVMLKASPINTSATGR